MRAGTERHGEDFREDLRGAVPPADAAQARRVIPKERLAELTALSPWRSSLALALTFATLALALGLAWTHFTWWVVVPAVLLIGTQQHALFVLAHDAAHYRLFETRWLNDAAGRFVGSIGGVSMMSYRVIHRLHHNALYSEVDPDIALHGGYPRGKAYLLKQGTWNARCVTPITRRRLEVGRRPGLRRVRMPRRHGLRSDAETAPLC